MPKSTRRCPRCGETRTFSGAYCRPCFADYVRERRGHPARADMPCAMCRTVFHQPRFDSRFCSTRCADAARYRASRIDPGFREHRARYSREYHRVHRDERLAAGKRWRDANRDSFRSAQRAWAIANREAIVANRARYRLTHRVELANKEARRRNRFRTVLVIIPSAEQMAAKLAYWGDCCWMCGGTADTLDHVKPIAAMGPHILANMRPACRSCNSAKNSKWFGPHDLSMFIRQ